METTNFYFSEAAKVLNVPYQGNEDKFELSLLKTQECEFIYVVYKEEAKAFYCDIVGFEDGSAYFLREQFVKLVIGERSKLMLWDKAKEKYSTFYSGTQKCQFSNAVLHNPVSNSSIALLTIFLEDRILVNEQGILKYNDNECIVVEVPGKGFLLWRADETYPCELAAMSRKITEQELNAIIAGDKDGKIENFREGGDYDGDSSWSYGLLHLWNRCCSFLKR